MRRLRLRTDHGDADRAAAIAAAVRPDNTGDIETAVEGESVVTTVERSTTGSLQSTVDDYVVNLHTAAQLTAQRTDDTNDTNP